MSRTTRLFDLLQLLRRHRHPVSGAELAAQLDISLRTLYRDIASLQAQGAPIVGEAGLGYVLQPGFMLPPLMFSEEELEALALGVRWVAERGDAQLADAATHLLAKIEAVLPGELRHALQSSALIVPPGDTVPGADRHLAELRHAIRQEQRLRLDYLDLKDARSERTVWPFALGYFDRVRVLVAFCELRQAVRHFRCDRIQGLRLLGERYPRRRQALLKEWRAAQAELAAPAETSADTPAHAHPSTSA